jgi:hypothetical protein
MTGARRKEIDRDRYDVLVGWKHTTFDDRLILHLQTMQAASSVETSHVVMTAQQATVLANYLLKAAGASPPPRPRSRLERWFGS